MIMKKSILFIFLCIAIFSCVGYGYSYFSYEKDYFDSVDANTTNANANFNEIDNDYYKVYFFASPYYSTGAEINGSYVDDPLEIADNENNPYNNTDELIYITPNLNNSPKFANVYFENGGNYHYITYKSRNEDIPLGTSNAFEGFQTRDFTGYIRENNANKIEQTYTYTSIIINNNITVGQLSSMIASTEFKDKYGFGPEFTGWTYDKETIKNRTMYGEKRYSNSMGLNLAYNSGYTKSYNADEIGNYGCQGEIDQITPTTSLRYIDSLTSDNGTIGIDGSKVGDKIIYLYPVYTAKNYARNETQSSLLKFRVNVDNSIDYDESIYLHNQSGEIDYSKNRYTVCLFQENDENDLNINYYTSNLLIDSSNTMQLDINMSIGGWLGDWNTILSNERMKALNNLTDGYYNVDITFAIVSDSYDESNIKNLYNKYLNEHKYVEICYSENDKGECGIEKFYYNNNWSYASCYYIVGFQKINEFHITGNSLNGNINNYDLQGFKMMYVTSNSKYYMSNNIFLKEDDEISILIDGVTNYNETPYSFSSNFSNDELSEIKSLFSNNNDNDFLNLGDNKNIELVYGQNGYKKLLINKTGKYNFIFNIEYTDGIPTNINICYQENSVKFLFVILQNKPSDNVFIEYDDLRKNNIVGACELSWYSTINLNTILYKDYKNPTESAVSNLESIFNENNIVDTATGLTLTKEHFENDDFYLNRNYILYLEAK